MKQQYKVVQEYDSMVLEEVVNGLMKDGWKAQGSVSVVVAMNKNDGYMERFTIFTQALVRDVR